MKFEDIIKYDDSFKELADILEKKEETELLNLSSFDTFVQDIFSLSYPQFSFRSWHIRKICSFIDDVLNSENKMAVMALPRYHLKSTISGHALILYRFLKCYGDAFYCSYKDELAGIHLSNMKREVESNPILSKIMIDLKSRSESGIHYKIGNKKVRLYSAGVFSVKRGIHVDSACLLPGQKILTSGRPGKNYTGGYKNIEDIKIGTPVLTHKNRYRKVTNVFCRDVDEDILKLTLNNREIIYVTKEHPILTTDGWKPASKLSREDILFKVKKYIHPIKGKTYEEIYGSEKAIELKKDKFSKIINGTRIWKIEEERYSGKVHNLEIEEDNTFSGRGIIFHNCIADDLLGTVENPMTLGELEKAERMFNQEIINIPNKGCPLIVFGTTIDYSDLLFKLKDNSEFMNLWMPAIHPDTEHEVLWEDVFDKKTLEIKKRASGWKAFSTEFLLTPVSATEAFLTREEIDRVIDTNLKSLSIFRKFEKEGRNVVAGLDIGKRRNPSHLSVFVSDENDNLIQICQEFWDEMEYIEQVKNIGIAIENFGIDKMFIDATRGEMEERGLPRECILIKFTGRGGRNQQSYATDFAKYVENKQIRLIDDDRFISQIVCMRNDLKAPNSPWGHGDSFWSVALAVGAFQDFYAKGRKKGFSYLGNLTESFEEKKTDIMKDDNICKICNRRAFETLEDGRIRCKNCGVLK